MSAPPATNLDVTGPIPTAITISSFAKPARFMTTPSQRRMTWNQLVLLLSMHERTGDKDGQGWSPLLYKAGTTRANVNVVGQTCAVADFEHLTADDGQAIQQHLASLNLAFCIYSTYQCTADDYRIRVVIPFTRTVKSNETFDVWQRVNEHIWLGRNDPQTKDASRMFYRPACPPDAVPFAEHHDGLALDPDKLPAATYAAQEHRNGTTSRGAISHLGYETYRFITFGAEIGHQRGAALAATRNCLAAGHSIEETAGLVWRGLQVSPQGDDEDPWTYEHALALAEDLASREPTPLTPRRIIEPAKPPSVAYRQTPSPGGNGRVHTDEPAPPNGSTAPEGIATIPPRRPLTQLGNSERLVDRFGDRLLYSHPWNSWLPWDDKRWKLDNTGQVVTRAKAVVRMIYGEAGDAETKEERAALANWARQSEAEKHINAMITLARSALPALPEQFDTDPWLLNVQNGTVDLRTGELREHRREDFITKLIDIEYDPTATAPLWQTFLERVQPDQTIRDFLQRSAGYSATGSARERCVLIPYGPGKNGKGVFLQTLRQVLSEYAVRTPSETFLTKRADAIPNDVAQLRATRFVFASETNEGRRLAEATIKDLTGGEDISARFMRGEWFSFTPTFTPWLATNHKPVIRGTDPAIWDRIRLIPFAVRIPDEEQDPRLLDKLRAEYRGILAWIVRGAIDWYEHGLGTPAAVAAATEGYRDEMDVIGTFIGERCVIDPQAYVAVAALYTSYSSWCEQSGERSLAKQAFGLRLVERGFQTQRGAKGVRRWVGLRLLGADESPPGDVGDVGDIENDITDHSDGPRVGQPKTASPSSPTSPNGGYSCGDDPDEEDEESGTRVSNCWNCKQPIATGLNPDCDSCGWLICDCGACEEGCSGGAA